MHGANSPTPPRLGDFDIKGILGQGGSGVVYRARWGHREVALKVLGPDLALTDRERQRFFAEAKTLAAIEHPAVVKVMGAGELPDGRPYLVMELLAGQTLAARLQDSPLPLDVAAHLFTELAGAVQAIHDQGLVHRDLKPENVMLTGDGGHLVLLDFGIAKELHAPDSTVTQEGSIRGSPAYMAPERFFGRKAGTSSDIYELAVILYAMLAGRLPWDSHDDPSARLGAPPVSRFRPDVSDELSALLGQALSTRAENRPTSARQLAERVAAAVASQTDHSPRVTDALALAPQSPQRFDRRAATTGGTSDPATRHPAPRTRPRRVWGWVAALIGMAAVAAAAFALTRGADGQDLEADSKNDLATDDETVATPAPPTEPRTVPTWPLDDDRASDSYRRLPDDVRLFVTVRFGALRRHPTFGPVLDKLRARPEYGLVATATAGCDADLIDNLSWTTIAMSGKDDDVYALAQSRLSRKGVESCLGQQLGKVTQKGATTTIGSANILWLTERAFLISSAPTIDDAWFEARLGDVDNLDDEAFGGTIAAIDPSAEIFGAGDASFLWPELDTDVPAPRFAAGHVALEQGLAAKFVLQFANEATAVQAQTLLSKKAESAKKEAGAALETLSVERDGVRVVMLAKVPKLYLGMIASMLKNQLGS